jgi:hypothetical protein
VASEAIIVDGVRAVEKLTAETVIIRREPCEMHYEEWEADPDSINFEACEKCWHNVVAVEPGSVSTSYRLADGRLVPASAAGEAGDA